MRSSSSLLAGCLAPVLVKQAAPPHAELLLAENVLICAGCSEVEFASLLAAAQRLPYTRPLSIARQAAHRHGT